MGFLDHAGLCHLAQASAGAVSLQAEARGHVSNGAARVLAEVLDDLRMTVTPSRRRRGRGTRRRAGRSARRLGIRCWAFCVPSGATRVECATLARCGRHSLGGRCRGLFSGHAVVAPKLLDLLLDPREPCLRVSALGFE